MTFLLRNICKALNQPRILQNLAVTLSSSLIKPSSAGLHTTNPVQAGFLKGPRRFDQHNKVIYPPQEPSEEPRKAVSVSFSLTNGADVGFLLQFVCLTKKNIKYSPKKMWYIATFVRGMSVDEAVKQLSFLMKKGAGIVKEAILEAQELAVKHHNVEYKSNLWVAESFCTKGEYFKGIRRHARMRFGVIQYKHCHYFVRLEEGTPPKNYYLPEPMNPQQQLDEWLEKMRKRKVVNSL